MRKPKVHPPRSPFSIPPRPGPPGHHIITTYPHPHKPFYTHQAPCQPHQPTEQTPPIITLNNPYKTRNLAAMKVDPNECLLQYYVFTDVPEYPGKYVVREYLMLKGRMYIGLEPMYITDTLAEIRIEFSERRGCTFLLREESDLPGIMGCWM